MSNSEEKLLYAALAKNFYMFLEKCYQEIDGGEDYTVTDAMKLIIDKLKKLENGDIWRLLINVPPRSMKSTIISIAYTAWLLGQNPKLKIMCISHDDELAKEFSIATRQIIQSDWYKKTFPKTRLWPWGRRDDYLQTTQGGHRRAASMGGKITGRGANLIIIDDPQKAQDILSDTKRKKSNEIFSSTILSRLNNKVKGQIMVVSQRLHPEDFSGYVQKFGEWEKLVIPAIEETDRTYALADGTTIERKAGSVINPDLEPLEKLEELRRGMGEFHFSAQYQQSPIPTKGNIINFDDFAFYNELPPTQGTRYFQSWDVAAKTSEKNDYSVCVTAAIHNKVAYIVDISRYKLDFTDLLCEIKRMQCAYSAQRVIIEDIGIGTSLISYLRQDGLVAMPCLPTLSKADRATAKTYLIRQCSVCLPQHAPWLTDFKEEIQAFP